MPTIDVKDWNNKKVGSVDLPEEIFAYPYKEHLVHEAVRNYLASLRQGTHKTKTRSEVAGSGKKPFRQKGTGRARQGGNRPPIHRHGGTVFGPQPRDYSYKMNTKEKKAALKSALSQRVKEGKFVVVDNMSVDEAKTKSFAQKVAAIGVEGKALLIDTMENTNALLASRNNPKLNFVDALHVNVYDVVNSRYIVLSQAALDRLTEALSNER
ncbi:MAG TPA: 50S ribosomal protein L4 [Thermoanaerobaculia bacterium]|jgi:large subunit ribosomal protein L4|nr:50S ribosomal protein L4 [Thermoanaerobaculia bacterium]